MYTEPIGFQTRESIGIFMLRFRKYGEENLSKSRKGVENYAIYSTRSDTGS